MVSPPAVTERIGQPTPRRGLEKVGRYEIVERLGRGATGSVYRALDTAIQRSVALKVVYKPDASGDVHEHQAFARFLREARAAGRLTHPNVVTVFDVGEDCEVGASYIAMELVEGEALDRILGRRQQLGTDQVRRIGEQVASALHAAHQAGIVHRDIKPANLLLTTDGNVKVADFGIAKLTSANVTTDGTFLGSPGYMSPEQINAAIVDHRSDIFSLGTVLYELCTVTRAFPGTTIVDIIRSVSAAKPKSPREVRPNLSPGMERVILRAMSRQREDRFQSAAEMLEALRELEGEPDSSSATADMTTTKRMRTPLRGWLPLAISALVGGIVVTAAIFVGRASVSPAAADPDASRPERPPAMVIATARPGEPLADADEPVVPGDPSGKPRPRRAAPTRLEPMPVPQTPAPTPTPEPSAPVVVTSVPRFEGRYRVTHRHRLGSCAGILTVTGDRIEYHAEGRGEDNNALTRADVREAQVTARDLTLVVNERALGLRAKRYRYEIQEAEFPRALADHLESWRLR